jgi:hypothetical protein
MHSLSCIDTDYTEDRTQSGYTQHNTVLIFTTNPSHKVSSHLTRAPDCVAALATVSS